LTYLTRPNIWTVSELRSHAERKNIKIPSFQRRLRWSEEKKRQLLDSIDEGLPIGTILVHSVLGKPYLLVDGLQRVTTIIESANRPYSFLTPAFVAANELENLHARDKSQLTTSENSAILGAIKEWLSGDHPENLLSTNKLQADLEAATDRINSTDLAYFASKITENASIAVNRRENYPIPVISYEGPISDLPEIFQRLNENGTKLTKYEIYMATWDGRGLIEPADPEMAEHVLDRFDGAEEYGMQVESSHPGLLTLGEYLLTLGHDICRDRPRLFGTEYEEVADSIAFQAACLALALPIANMEKLDDHMGTILDKKSDWEGHVPRFSEDSKTGFRAGLLAAADFWENVLSATRWDNAKYPLPHGSLVTTAMIVAAMLEARGENVGSDGRWVGTAAWPRQKSTNQIHTIALRRYVMALLSPELTRQYGKIQDLVWSDGEDGAGHRIPRRWFFTEPTQDQLSVFDVWWATQLQRPMGRGVSALNKTLLAVITKRLQPQMGIPWGKLEVDHVVSWARMESMGWQERHPVSSVANICILDKQTNGALKKAGSLNSLLNHPEMMGEKEEQRKRIAMIESNVFLSDSALKRTLLELDEVIYSDSSDAEDAFRKFIDARWLVLKEYLAGLR
jgi:hypothetical protein